LKKLCYNNYVNKILEDKTMAHKISEECVACGACADICPVGAIVLDEAKGIYVITDECVDCGACEDGCPVGAIKAE
jgi:NAD-dependent dihydropyrimidine dehydrogenase PreA subunit